MLKDSIYNAPKYAGVYKISNDEHKVYIGYALKLRQTLIKLYNSDTFKSLDTDSATLELLYAVADSHKKGLESFLVDEANKHITEYKEKADIDLLTTELYTLTNKDTTVENTNSASHPDWINIYDISTKCTHTSSTTNYEHIIKDISSCTVQEHFNDAILIDNRFICYPYDKKYTDEEFNEIKDKLIDRAYFEIDGYIYTDLEVGLIDLFVSQPVIPDELLLDMLSPKFDDKEKLVELIHKCRTQSLITKYIPMKEFCDYEKVHGSNQVMEHFDLTKEQYKTLCKKFGLRR